LNPADSHNSEQSNDEQPNYEGKMGFIAPNLWMENEYGATLRANLKYGRNLDRLKLECKMLDQSCSGITVGIQTSADNIYHLTRISQNKYRTKNGVELSIEDSIMRPLVSGQEAKRYQSPMPNTYLLFPYDISGKKPQLIPEVTFESKFPNAWNYLKLNEKELNCLVFKLYKLTTDEIMLVENG
jgi:hypothetical protein